MSLIVNVSMVFRIGVVVVVWFRGVEEFRIVMVFVIFYGYVLINLLFGGVIFRYFVFLVVGFLKMLFDLVFLGKKFCW